MERLMRVETRLLKATEENLIEAAQVIRDGGLVAFPTETVYGLGADGLNELAVGKIFEAKGRPSDNPLILHVSSPENVEELVAEVPAEARLLMEAFWPGPLTIVLKKSDKVPSIVTAGLDTVAVRLPGNAVARRLIELAGRPIAAPSANLSGRPSATRAEHVVRDLSGRIDMVIDGGPTVVGLESTVLDLTGEAPVILRHGGVTREMLEKVVGEVMVAGGEQSRPRSPGLKYTHYAPDAELIVVRGDSPEERLVDLYRLLSGEGRRVGAVLSRESAEVFRKKRLPLEVVRILGSRSDPAGAASALFSALRDLDEKGVEVILAEGFSERGVGVALMDRLLRAAGGRVVGEPPSKRLLFVCTGNTCRSPMAAAIFNHLARRSGKNWTAESAGVGAVEGIPASPEAVQVMKGQGLDISGHRSRPFGSDLAGGFDLILTMTELQKRQVKELAPESRVYTIGEFAGVDRPVEDPIGGDTARYESCREDLEGMILRVLGKLDETFSRREGK